MYKTAVLFVARLTEVEKCIIRAAATIDRLDWLFHAQYRRELVGSDAEARKIFDEAIASIKATYIENSRFNVFGRTWSF